MKFSKPIIILIFIGIAAILLAGCFAISNAPGLPQIAGMDIPIGVFGSFGNPVSGTTSSTVNSVIVANNKFAIDMYHALSNRPEYENDNIFFSPYSISNVFSITFEGAGGKTADEIQSVFHLPENSTIRRLGYSIIADGLNNPKAPYTLFIANALWAEKTYPFLPEYVAVVTGNYRANASNVDFVHTPEESRQTINKWVEGKTGNKIHGMIPQGIIDSYTRLVITNAVYFRGTWVKEFNTAETTNTSFTTLAGEKKMVPMMQRGDQNTYLGYYETWTYQALELPYKSSPGRNLSMLVILPKANDLNTVDYQLNADEIDSIEKSLSSTRIVVSLPKFSITSEIELPVVLSGMGMPSAFGGDADLSGMDGTQNLYIKNAIHKAAIDVGEKGTEAAAATVAVIVLKGVDSTPIPIPEFVADHPFIFLIIDKDDGAILFMGRVTDPSSRK